MFGVEFARLYVSARLARPTAYASTATRSSPVTRESSVPVGDRRARADEALAVGD